MGALAPLQAHGRATWPRVVQPGSALRCAPEPDWTLALAPPVPVSRRVSTPRVKRDQGDEACAPTAAGLPGAAAAAPMPAQGALGPVRQRKGCGGWAGTDGRDEGAPVRGRAQVEAAVVRHERAGAWRLPMFARHEDRRLFCRLRAVRELMRALPPGAIALVLGPDSERAVPDLTTRRALAQAVLERKAGPDGGAAKGACRAWRLLSEEAAKQSYAAVPLPTPPALAGAVLRRVVGAARAAGKGSQAGATVGPSVLAGMEWLEAAGIPVGASHPVARAAACAQVSDEIARPRRQAAAPPLGVRCQLEWLAALPGCAPAQFWARSLLVGAFAHNIRLNDALNATLWMEGGVITGRTTVRSKDGLPLSLYAPADGWLGPWPWAEEHVAACAARGTVFPNWEGRSVASASTLCPGVVSRTRAVSALQQLCGLPPLEMARAEFAALRITGHSIHVEGADMLRFLKSEHGFSYDDIRAVGHWLRDRRAEPAVQEDAHGRGHGRPAGAANGRQVMGHRYSQGDGRRGERAEQLDVRGRLNGVVRAGLAACSSPWHALPRTLDSWDVLVSAPPEVARDAMPAELSESGAGSDGGDM